MSGWLVILILAVMLVVSVVIVVVTRRDDARRAARERRFEIRDTGQRIPLAADRPPAPATSPVAEIAPPPARPSPERTPDAEAAALATVTEAEDEGMLPPRGRLVRSADGEMLLTDPPFKRRGTIFTKRHGKYALGLIRRLPPWLVICPRVRLDTLVSPTSPDGRDPADWREWRRRVRVRSVDLVLVDRRTWEPILAIMLDKDARPSATTIGGGRDRIIDEVLAAVEIPLVRGSGSLKEDWAAIRPYVDHAMLPTAEDGDREPVLGHAMWDASMAVKLLNVDEERGGLLE